MCFERVNRELIRPKRLNIIRIVDPVPTVQIRERKIIV